MKRTMVFVFVMLICVIVAGGALADPGCGNEHYFNCGGGVGNDGTVYHEPGTNQRFRCYEHITVTTTGKCNVHDKCIATITTIYHHYKCKKGTYGSDGSYETQYRQTTTHTFNE